MSLTKSNSFNKQQVEQLRLFGQNINRLGANFAVFDSKGKPVEACESSAFRSDWKSIFTSFSEFRKKNKECTGNAVRLNEFTLSAVISDLGLEWFIFINLPQKTQLSLNPKGTFVVQTEQLHVILFDYLSLLVDDFQSHLKFNKSVQVFTRELSQVYEELTLIHKLSSYMKISDSGRNFLKIACRSLSDFINIEGISILLEDETTGSLAKAAGLGLVDFDETMVINLKERLIAELNNGKEALIDSNAFSEFKYNWPVNLKSIIAVPLYAKERSNSSVDSENPVSIIGILFAVNRLDKPDFDTADIKLFNSVASSCAVFVENGRLFNDLKELFIGSLKALTSSIDAKDKYTRGHSDRVAAIAKWIAQRYSECGNLDDEQINNIYIAGLLHDIGKIGIAEAVLCKNGKLTDDEMNCIKRHPSIGAGILSGIKQMQIIIPAVLSHHERIDGKGYPNGLSGDNIPLSAKIIALADGFDAMTSARVYRPAMSIERALDEIRNNIGKQYDEKIALMFLNSNINDFWKELQHQRSDYYEDNDVFQSQYSPPVMVDK
jgi:HD-GYP domain-containing protein (c-di-GMP phosphodiesterase class II)